jgi:hypothetical protein
MLKIPPPEEAQYNDYQLNSLFLTYLDRLEETLCKRCWYIRKSLDNSTWHNRGGFVRQMCKGQNIHQEQFEQYKNDIEHGFFHGFIAGFWVFMQLSENGKKIIKCFDNFKVEYSTSKLTLENSLLSCFFHDFLKTIGQNDKHDENLNQYFTELLPETYSHSKPTQESINKPLVVADRIELHRYADAASWIDYKTLYQSDYIQKNRNLISQFYNKFFHALKELYEFREMIWISHVSETIWLRRPNDVHIKFYPEWYFKHTANQHTDVTQEEMNKYFCAYADYLSLHGCLNHVWQDFKEQAKFQVTYGLMTKKRLESLGNRLVVSPPFSGGREHPYVYVENPMLQSEWIFVYDDESDLHCVNKHQNKIIQMKVLQRMLHVWNLFFSKIEAHKITS